MSTTLANGHQQFSKKKLQLSRPAKGSETVPNVTQLDDNVAKDLVQTFKLLADETRLRILCFLLQEQELNVRTLCELLGQSQPAVSHHLALLRVAGMIESRRDGKHNFYRLLSTKIQEQLEMFFQATPDQPNSLRFGDFELNLSTQENSVS